MSELKQIVGMVFFTAAASIMVYAALTRLGFLWAIVATVIFFCGFCVGVMIEALLRNRFSQ